MKKSISFTIMRKSLFVLFFVGALLFGSCCKIIMPEKPEDVYYLRYEASADMPTGKTLQVAFNNLKGEEEVFKIEGKNSFSIVVGPVKYGFEAYVWANTLGSGSTNGVTTTLYISKNNGPYTWITSDGGEHYLSSSINYTIDF